MPNTIEGMENEILCKSSISLSAFFHRSFQKGVDNTQGARMNMLFMHIALICEPLRCRSIVINDI